MTTTDIDIDAIRQREQAATEGPWRAHTTYPQNVFQGSEEELNLVSTTLSGHPAADAEFIAHARTDVPALLAKLDELTAELEALRPLADAAAAWRRFIGDDEVQFSEVEALIKAVDALPNLQEPCDICSGYGCPDCRDDEAVAR